MTRVVSSVILLVLSAMLGASNGQGIKGNIKGVCSSFAYAQGNYDCSCFPTGVAAAPAPARAPAAYSPPIAPQSRPAPPAPVYAPAPAPAAPRPPSPPAAPAGIYVQQPGGQPQLVANQGSGAPGSPIIIQLQPQPITVNQAAAAQQQRPAIGAQSKEGGPPAPPAPPAAPATPAPPPQTTTPDLISQVFIGDGPGATTRCPPFTPINWFYRTWTTGAIRPYYENAGFRSTFEECKEVCAHKDTCYFATRTGAGTCYLLTTSTNDKCDFLTKGHNGQPGELCTDRYPCPSAYKQCASPRCTLQSITEVYCSSKSKVNALQTCVYQ